MKQSAAPTHAVLHDLSCRGSSAQERLKADPLSLTTQKVPPIFTPNCLDKILGLNRYKLYRHYSKHKGGEQRGAHFDVESISKLFNSYGYRFGKPKKAYVVAVMNQRNNTGKTTTVLNLVPFAALNGYRVLVVDLDDQASFTAFCGVRPNIDVTIQDTVAATLWPQLEPPRSIADLIRHHQAFPGLIYDFVPACQGIATVGDITFLKHRNLHLTTTNCMDRDHGLAGTPTFLHNFTKSLDAIRKSYDLIVVDCPSNTSLLSYVAAFIADALIIPIKASKVDIASTCSFIDWLKTAHQYIKFHFTQILMLITDFDGHSDSIRQAECIREWFGDAVLDGTIVHSREISLAAGQLRSLYELSSANRSNVEFSRTHSSLDSTNAEILTRLSVDWHT